MVKRTVETFECDICGSEGERYTVSFPDGFLALDRCSKHDKKILALRDEKGSWVHAQNQRAVFKVSTLEDIEKQKRTKKR